MKVYVLIVEDTIAGVYSSYETCVECESIFRSKESLYAGSETHIECHILKE